MAEPRPQSGSDGRSLRHSQMNSDLTLEITEATRVVPPGGVVTLKYVLYSPDGDPVRIRLHVDAPPGWRWVDAEKAETDRVLESWEVVREELRVAAPIDARVGQRQLIRVVVEAIGAPGIAEALAHVQVLDGGGLKLGGSHLAGSTALTVSQLAASGLETARLAAMAELSGKLPGRTNLALRYHQGPRENLSNHRYPVEATTLSGSVVNGGWNFEFGTEIHSAGTAVTGPFVNGSGIAMRRLNGRLTGELVLAQPTTFRGEGAGHLWRGNLAIRTAVGRIGFALSDFARPEGGYTTLPPVPDPTLDPDSLEVLERERERSAARAATRVQGFGVDANLQFTRNHRFILRAGRLRLGSAEGEAASAPSVEAQYSFNARNANLNTRWRQGPPSVQGVYLPGNELSADGSLRMIRELSLVGRAYRYENETLGDSTRGLIEGGSVGLRYATRRWRVEARGNRRAAEWASRNLRRTGQLTVGVPIGPVSLHANTEIGEEENVAGVRPYRSYRGDLRWSGDPGFASFGISSYSTAAGRSLLRADLLTSLVLGEFEIAGGAWATRGRTTLRKPGIWTSVSVPVTPEYALLLGIEHAEQPLTPDGSPWRATVGLRRKLIVPLPFRGEGASAPAPVRRAEISD